MRITPVYYYLPSYNTNGNGLCANDFLAKTPNFQQLKVVQKYFITCLFSNHLAYCTVVVHYSAAPVEISGEYNNKKRSRILITSNCYPFIIPRL